MQSGERNEYEGFLLVAKPIGLTSHDVVDRVRRRFHYRKVGHAGTLDPFAGGLLLLGIGRKATRCLREFMDEDKEYEAVMVLGIETDSQDVTGRVVKKGEWRSVTEHDLRQALENFRGAQSQVPPMHSALKYKGKPLYKLARKGVVVPRKERAIDIYDIDLLEFKPPEARLRLRCSKGTYVRTLCADIGNALGCGAYLKNLVRTRSGGFSLKNALGLEQLLTLSAEEVREKIIPVASS